MTFESALRRVTGHSAPLWSQADPGGGWLRTVAPGTASWWNYYPYGEMIFSVDRNDDALAGWNRTLAAVDRVMPEVAGGRYRLMQVPMLRDAGGRVATYGADLGSGARQARSLAGPVLERAGIEGAAAESLGTRFQAVATRLERKHGELTTGAPTVAVALDEAAEALASFGEQMSEAWRAARPALGSTVEDDIDGLYADIVSFLGRHDLATPDGVLISYATDDPAGESTRVRELFRTYLPQGHLPSGTSGAFGSPADPSFWSSASTGITNGLTTALQQLDDAADRAIGELRDAYRRAVRAMGGTLTPEPPDTGTVAQGRRSGAALSTARAGTPMRARTGVSMSALTPAIRSAAVPMGRVVPATRADATE